MIFLGESGGDRFVVVFMVDLVCGRYVNKGRTGNGCDPYEKELWSLLLLT